VTATTVGSSAALGGRGTMRIVIFPIWPDCRPESRRYGGIVLVPNGTGISLESLDYFEILEIVFFPL
jgi:hypothetical protein